MIIFNFVLLLISTLLVISTKLAVNIEELLDELQDTSSLTKLLYFAFGFIVLCLYVYILIKLYLNSSFKITLVDQ